jgi:hypothetical protein
MGRDHSHPAQRPSDRGSSYGLGYLAASIAYPWHILEILNRTFDSFPTGSANHGVEQTYGETETHKSLGRVILGPPLLFSCLIIVYGGARMLESRSPIVFPILENATNLAGRGGRHMTALLTTLENIRILTF